MQLELIDSIETENDRATVRFTTRRGQAIFRAPFWYRCNDIDLAGISDTTLSVPFFLNIAPVLWRLGGEYGSRHLDPVLAQALEKIRLEFVKRDSHGRWPGRIRSSAEACQSSGIADPSAAAMLFSGGVDSLATSLQLEASRKALVIVRGNDVELENPEAWARAQSLAACHAGRLAARLFFIESNMYEFIDQAALDKTLPGSASWWGSIQHGMGLCGLLSVPCHLTGASRAVIAATHSAGFEGKSWGSTPVTDELIQWGDVRVEHHGYASNRQQKIRTIVEYSDSIGAGIELRVCFRTVDGSNCGECEKCLRSVAALILEGRSPVEFGLPVADDAAVDRVRSFLRTGRLRGDPNTIFHWNTLQRRALELQSQCEEMAGARAGMGEVILAYNFNRRARWWRWRERIKKIADHVFRIVPVVERPVRRLVSRLRGKTQ